jgi:predicted nucleic acid-binding protein
LKFHQIFSGVFVNVKFYQVFSGVHLRFMNPTKNLIDLKLYIIPTKILIELKPLQEPHYKPDRT